MLEKGVETGLDFKVVFRIASKSILQETYILMLFEWV